MVVFVCCYLVFCSWFIYSIMVAFNTLSAGVIYFPTTPVEFNDLMITFSCVDSMVNVTYFDGFSNFLTQLLLQPNASLILGGFLFFFCFRSNELNRSALGRTNV